jgi:hypothetical protein
MPKGLDATFKETLDRIERQPKSRAKLGMRTLMWISHARRPILVKELCQALAVKPGDTCLDQDDCPLPKRMVDYSLGLVTIDEESSTVRLVHFSVQEYFRENRKEIFPMGERTVTESCLTYLSFKVFGEGYCANDEEFEARLQLYPFLNYAARHWVHHGREDPSDENVKLALKFLLNDQNLACSIQVMHTPEYRYSGYSQDFPKNLGALHIAASFGLNVLVRLLLESKGVEPDSKDSGGQTPLSWAAGNGHEAVVRLLLDSKGVEPDSKDSGGRTPLSWAAGNGHEAVVRLLLGSKGVEPDSKDSHYGRTPLSWAARRGHEAVVRLLLDSKGVEPDSKDSDGRTPLSWAAENGHEAVVRLLLGSKGVEPDSKDSDGRTPLSWAARRGHEAVMRLLQSVVNSNG